jgi:acetyltransferase
VRPDLLVRPLHPGDAQAVQAFIQGLSVRARVERYFYPLRELTPVELGRIITPGDARDLSLGVFEKSRLVAIGQCAAGEFGVVVADDWQGRGLGRELLERLLAHARRQRLASLHGLVRAGNRAMLRLAASLGFRVAPDEDPGLLRVEHPLAHA